jgi:hypothetical protein
MADAGTLSRLTAFWNNEVDLRDQEIRRLSGVNAHIIQKLRDLKLGVIDLSLIQILEDGSIQILGRAIIDSDSVAHLCDTEL